MAILNRVQRLFRADLHALLDSVEDPRTLLKQALREMEEALDQKRRRLTGVEQAIQALELSCRRCGEKISQVGEDLELALSKGNEAVCRKLIARKLTLQRQLDQQRGHLEASRRKGEALAEEIRGQQEQYESIRERAEFLIPAPPDDSPESVAESILSPAAGPSTGGELRISEEEIELEWIRLQNQKGEES